MKILGLVILKQKRLKSVLQLLKGSKEDLVIAAELLEGKREIKPPKYKIEIEHFKAYLWFLNKQDSWVIIDSVIDRDFSIEFNKQDVLQRFRRKIDTQETPFEKIVINY